MKLNGKESWVVFGISLFLIAVGIWIAIDQAKPWYVPIPVATLWVGIPIGLRI